jgi:sulfoacetaldehyde dehydrogenase
VVAEAAYRRFIACLARKGGYLCSDREADAVRRTMWPDGDRVSRDLVGRSAQVIAARAGFSVPAATRALLIEGDENIDSDPVSREKLAPVLGIWRYGGDFGHAVAMVEKLTSASGRGHSCGIYSNCAAHIERIAAETRLSRVMVNQSTCFGNTGSFENGMPFSVVLSCGTWGGSTTTDNICWRHFLNYTWVSEPIARRRRPLRELFGRHWHAG